MCRGIRPLTKQTAYRRDGVAITSPPRSMMLDAYRTRAGKFGPVCFAHVGLRRLDLRVDPVSASAFPAGVTRRSGLLSPTSPPESNSARPSRDFPASVSVGFDCLDKSC